MDTTLNILGGLVAALIVFFLIQNIKRRNQSGEIPEGAANDWLLFAAIMGGVVLFIILLIMMI